MVSMLMHAGADVTAKDRAGKLPKEMAKTPSMVNLLSSAEAELGEAAEAA